MYIISYLSYVFHMYNETIVHNLFILNNSLHFVNNSFCKYVRELLALLFRHTLVFGKIWMAWGDKILNL